MSSTDAWVSPTKKEQLTKAEKTPEKPTKVLNTVQLNEKNWSSPKTPNMNILSEKEPSNSSAHVSTPVSLLIS
jgi:hypothetical protein